MIDQIDKTNQRILNALVANARLPVTELAKIVGLSKTPVALRIRQMTYVSVNLSDTRQKALEAFNAAVRKIPEVEECYMIAGGFDYQLKIRTRDMPHFRDVMATSISTLPHVSSTNSYVAMEAVVEQGWGMAE